MAPPSLSSDPTLLHPHTFPRAWHHPASHPPPHPLQRVQAIALRDLRVIGQLGSGAFGQVSLVRYEGRYYALKALSKAHVLQAGLQVRYCGGRYCTERLRAPRGDSPEVEGLSVPSHAHRRSTLSARRRCRASSGAPSWWGWPRRSRTRTGSTCCWSWCRGASSSDTCR